MNARQRTTKESTLILESIRRCLRSRKFVSLAGRKATWNQKRGKNTSDSRRSQFQLSRKPTALWRQPCQTNPFSTARTVRITCSARTSEMVCHPNLGTWPPECRHSFSESISDQTEKCWNRLVLSQKTWIPLSTSKKIWRTTHNKSKAEVQKCSQRCLETSSPRSQNCTCQSSKS